MLTEELKIIFSTAALSMCASAFIPLFQHIKTKALPEVEYIKDDEDEKPTKLSKRNQNERLWYYFSCISLGLLVGTELALYWLGFDKTPNIYQQMFWALLAGFLTPEILSYVQNKINEKL